MGGGGGLLPWTIRLFTITTKQLYLSPPNLVTFVFIRRIWQNFSKIDLPGGFAAVVFEMRRLEKLNLRIFCFTSKPWKCRGGIHLCQKRCFQA